MNRFFSKLDLRDIKIDPEGSRFPPDADEREQAPPQGRAEAPVADGAGMPLLETVETEATTWESPTFEAPAPPHSGNGVATDVPAMGGHETGTLPNGKAGYEIDGVLIAADGEVLKVSARSRPSAVAGAIAGVVRESGRAEVQAIGAGATNQAVKAVAIARDYLRETGIEAVCLPAFIDVTIENEDRTAIRLVVEPR
jgi:stage V sporulation protein S